MAILAAYMVPHPPMIVPAVGRGSERQVQATTRAYEAVAEEIAELRPDTIVISSPHTIMYRDYFHISPGEGATGSFGMFRVPEVNFNERYDSELVSRISELAESEDFPAGTMGERDSSLDHGTMVPLYFIRQRYAGGRIVRVGLSGLSLADHYELGRIISRAAEELGRRIVFVASGDLSHKLQDYGPYGYAPEGPQYDRRIMDVCSRAAFDELFDFDEEFCDKAAECGHRSFVIMAGVLDGIEVEARQLSHEDVTGVGYGICTFHPVGTKDISDSDCRGSAIDSDGTRPAAYESGRGSINKDAGSCAFYNGTDPYVRLAWQSVESYIVKHRRLDMPSALPEEMLTRRAGAFVSIHKNGELRGCIGTISATRDSVASEIIANAISASTRDPRFDPITADELGELEISVDVLGDAEDIDSLEQLDVKRYGVIVSSGYRRGLLLPDLDGVDTVEQQVDIARRKAGIPVGAELELQRFEVIRHH